MSYKIHSEVFGPYENFMHIVEDVSTKQAIVIDPAWSAEYIIERLEKLQLTLVGIWLTHGHHDHTNALNDLRRVFPVEVYASKAEIDFIKNTPEATQNGLFLPLPEDVIPLVEGDRVFVGETVAAIIETPGHSQGCICYVFEKDVLTGDTLFVNGCGRTDLLGSSPDQLFESLNKIFNTLSHKLVIHTGHAYGPSETDTLENQLKTNPFLKNINKDQFVNYRMTH